MKLNSLKDLFMEQISDLYDAESQLVDALPKLQKAATSKALAGAFGNHLGQTKNHVQRLEQVFATVGAQATRKTCKAMQGLIAEGGEFLKAETENDSVRDAGLIAAAQRVEHYEMAAYGAARSFARLLGYSNAAELLQRTLDEEGDTDKALTDISVTVNSQAQQMAEPQSHRA